MNYGGREASPSPPPTPTPFVPRYRCSAPVSKQGGAPERQHARQMEGDPKAALEAVEQDRNPRSRGIGLANKLLLPWGQVRRWA